MSLPMSSHRFDVLISEVGPRDGLQSVASTMSTAPKLAIQAEGYVINIAANSPTH